jgi:hypothetical protein
MFNYGVFVNRRSGVSCTCPSCDSMEQRPSWEPNSRWAGEEIPRLLLEPKVHHRVHKNPPFAPILNQMNPFFIFISNSFKSHFNIIFTSTAWSPKWSFPVRASEYNSVWMSHLSKWHICLKLPKCLISHSVPSITGSAWFNSRTAGRIWIKFSMDIMPLGTTLKPYFFNFLLSVMLTWRTNKLLRWDRHERHLQ